MRTLGSVTNSALAFTKGHGTGNDFIIIDNRAGQDYSAEFVARLCDRRTGVGADGVLFVVPAAVAVSEIGETSARWFMDYRNSDGSVAAMCGNGARVFARYLRSVGLERDDEFVIATRGGDRAVVVDPAADEIRVEMGTPTRSDADVKVAVGESEWVGYPWWMPNPHAVVFVEDLTTLPESLPAPEVATDVFPDGQNVEFVEDVTVIEGSPHLRLRVYERGVGETQSCGTGVCAAAAALRWRLRIEGAGTTTVDVPGGRLRVAHDAGGGLELIGPAVLVATGQLAPAWLEGAR